MSRVATSILAVFVLQTVNFSRSELYNKQLTIYAEPGRQECYYHPIAASENINLQYEVIHGGHGEPNINFRLMNPNRNILVVETKRDKGQHKLVAYETGAYQICFDNTISSFNQKIVSFTLEITAANQKEEQLRELRKEMLLDYQFDKAYTEIDSYIRKIQVNLMKSRQTQDFIRAHEARDRNLAESNYAMVNNWSWAQFLAMILVGLLQVIMLRSIFSTDGTLYQFWKRF
ncbi:uncharacterized protein Dana_GF14850 [Drosophila ananassae]|uniref:GOLD domain-containing protein n=1 Tax=Drosophila ananassae TaxID=7217 RepID=B3MM10_DROAN|nr:transmembrane emp24 domain-containing protein 5 [Drosophila ananassae]EDV30825.1 uncharacterized protein Dana_GF14850 [Drosophila ananassae]